MSQSRSGAVFCLCDIWTGLGCKDAVPPISAAEHGEVTGGDPASALYVGAVATCSCGPGGD